MFWVQEKLSHKCETDTRPIIYSVLPIHQSGRWYRDSGSDAEQEEIRTVIVEERMRTLLILLIGNTPFLDELECRLSEGVPIIRKEMQSFIKHAGT